jgi:hypothetical protein
LISLQNNLKNLSLSDFQSGSWNYIIPILTKHSHKMTKLRLYSDRNDLPYSFISLCTNLQEIIFSIDVGIKDDNFEKLQYVNFSKLQTLKIYRIRSKPNYTKKFLENNGKNLKKLYIINEITSNTINLPIANFCPNLKSLHAIYSRDEVNTLKTTFINCKYLESIKIVCGLMYLKEKEVFETVANYSPDNFGELKMIIVSNPNVSSEDLESFFINWKNRKSKKLLKLTIIKLKIDQIDPSTCESLDENKENMKIIEKYENLGIIKFGTISYEEDLHVNEELKFEISY